MSAAPLVNHCAAYGAEEGLDSLLMRMIDHDETRRLVAELVTWSLPTGALVVRYLRLFKPAKQQLRMKTVHAVLAELVPAVRAGQLQRAGRVWHLGQAGWQAAIAAVLDAQDKGTLQLPLQGNAYLFEVARRMADSQEARAEEAHLQAARQGGAAPRTQVAAPVQDLVERALPGGPKSAPAPAPGTSPLVRQMREQLAAGRRSERG